MAYAPIYESSGPTVLAIAEEVKRKYPGDWANAHNQQASGAVYIRRVAWSVHFAYPHLNVGLNGKRGNVHDLSQDVLCFPNASGAPDAAGRWPGLEIRDIIASAGTPDARLVWGDVTQATIDKGEKGAWVAPAPVDEPTPDPPPHTCPVFPSYASLGDDAFFRTHVGVPLAADTATAGQVMNDGSTVWSSRTVHSLIDSFFRLGNYSEAPQIIKKHRNEWRAILGLPPL